MLCLPSNQQPWKSDASQATGGLPSSWLWPTLELSGNQLSCKSDAMRRPDATLRALYAFRLAQGCSANSFQGLVLVEAQLLGYLRLPEAT